MSVSHDPVASQDPACKPLKRFRRVLSPTECIDCLQNSLFTNTKGKLQCLQFGGALYIACSVAGDSIQSKVIEDRDKVLRESKTENSPEQGSSNCLIVTQLTD
jgi:hypothetical protein